MTQLSPSATIMWAILSVLELSFLLYHLFQFDRFQCLNWNSNRAQGAFKRMLTYAYLTSVPLMLAFAMPMCSLKNRYGYILSHDGSIVPTPSSMWDDSARSTARALYIMLSVVWGLEMVSHLEELNFWLFLLTTTAEARPWLESPHFIMWCVGSVIALVGMPAIAVFAEGVERTEAYVFIAGSVGSGFITLAGVRVMWLFPHFLGKIKLEGAEADVVSRLAKYHELNNIRLLFRTMFVISMMTLGVWGLNSIDTPVQLNPWSDMFAMLAAIGVCASSAITLIVFFPRSSPLEDPTPHGTYGGHAPPTARSTVRHSQARDSTLFRPQSKYSTTHSIEYPPTALSTSNSRDPWRTHTKNVSSSSFEYQVTVETYDDTGRRMTLRKPVEDLPYEAMRAAGMRYELPSLPPNVSDMSETCSTLDMVHSPGPAAHDR